MAYRIADFELDTRRELLIGPAGPVPLRQLLYRLLLLLAQRAPGVVGHDELLDTLWGPDAWSPGVLAQTVSELRRALGDDPRHPRLIATRHRRGYALIAPVLHLGAGPGGVPASLPRSGRGLLLRPVAVPPALAEAWRAVAAGANGWALRWPDEPLAPDERTWTLRMTGPRWQLQAPDDTHSLSGRLRQTTPMAQLGELLQALGEATGAGPLAWPEGWAAPASAAMPPAGAQRLCAAVVATVQGDHGAALQQFDALRAALPGAPGAGWPLFWLAQALAGAGRRAEARLQLQGFASTAPADPVLQLRIEALRGQLDGRRDEALSALRAAAMLAPDDLPLALAVLADQHALGLGQAALAQQARLQARLPPQDDAQRLARQAGMLLDRGEVAEAAALLDAAPGLEGLPGQPLAALRARCRLEQGQLAAARQLFESCAERLAQAGWPGPARQMRLGALEARLRAGDAEPVRMALLQLQSEAAADADPLLDTGLVLLLGRCHTALHQADEALRVLEEAAVLARRHGLQRLATAAQHHLGSALALMRRQPERAEACFRVAADGSRDLGDTLGEVRARANLALMAERAGRRLEARQAYQDTLRLLQPLKAVLELGRIAYNAGVNERDLGDLGAASAAFDLALAQLQTLPGSDLCTMAVATRADLALQMADPDTAAALLVASATAAAGSGPLPRSCWHTARARLLELAGDLPAAEAELDAADALRRRRGVRVSQIDLALRRSALRLAPGAVAGDAWLALERLEAELLRLGETKYALSAGLLTALASHEAGDHDAARDKAMALWPRAQRDGTRQQQLQADWVLAHGAPPGERQRRWRALAQDAADAGFALMALLAQHHARQATGEPPADWPPALRGALHNAAGAF